MQTWDPEALGSSVDLSEVDSEVSTERVPMSTSPKANTNYAAMEQYFTSVSSGTSPISTDNVFSVLIASELWDSEEEASLTEPAFKQPCEAQSSGPSKPAKTKESLEAKKIENEDLHGPAKSKKRK
ncbi:hypothetical protein SKAU_G00330510 [Synaphobranchus kaupii]|uniref:Uncharacterized protein n=1 Tax=Synaphobranchus kaupii TaxID=118154 RepID=A0A9Q1IIJ8_SYNKA|nr:hypothetical protein SKAU_G00330510 [Synaphobranchus kaupii]